MNKRQDTIWYTICVMYSKNQQYTCNSVWQYQDVSNAHSTGVAKECDSAICVWNRHTCNINLIIKNKFKLTGTEEYNINK